MRFPKILALLGILLFLVILADSQMNRDTPFLASKLPRTDDGLVVGQAGEPSSPVVISGAFNGDPVSDLFITPDAVNSTCDQASFWVSMTTTPGTYSGYQSVKVRVLENRAGTAVAVADLILLLPASGGQVHESIGFSSAIDPSSGAGSSEITVTADPDNQLSETNERNNAATIEASCSV